MWEYILYAFITLGVLTFFIEFVVPRLRNAGKREPVIDEETHSTLRNNAILARQRELNEASVAYEAAQQEKKRLKAIEDEAKRREASPPPPRGNVLGSDPNHVSSRPTAAAPRPATAPLKPRATAPSATTTAAAARPSASPAAITPTAAERSRALKEQQDREYAAALQADRAREQQDSSAALQEARDRFEAVARKQHRRACAARVPAEPPEDDLDGVTLMVRLDDGSHVKRRFRNRDPLRGVYDWLTASKDVNFDKKVLTTNFPRKVHARDDTTLYEAGLVPQATLFVSDE